MNRRLTRPEMSNRGENSRCCTIRDFVRNDIDASVSCNTDLDLRVNYQVVVEESRVDNMPCCGANQNLYRQQTLGISER